ncbi:MAG: SMC-Scp complex subunit ScpB [Chloroflexota bacterium]
MSERGARQEPLDIPADEDALALLEALLFAAGEPVTVDIIARTLEWKPGQVRAQLDALERQLVEERRGVVLVRHDDGYQLATAPRFGPVVTRLLSVERVVRISDPALETLAIIAYRQPVTRAEIEQVRGVDSSGVLSTLLARDLVEVKGQRQSPGTPNEYGTTDAFLMHFGITSLDELPASEDITRAAAESDEIAGDPG